MSDDRDWIDVARDEAFRAGQVAALRSLVIGLSFRLDRDDGLPPCDMNAGAFMRTGWIQDKAIEALAALGDPDARRIVGRE